MIAPLVARSAGRQVAARAYSHSAVARAATEPKLHNATGLWEGLKAKRPVDADDLHVSPFERGRRRREFQIPSPTNPTPPFSTLMIHSWCSTPPSTPPP
jgi:hypothetical protein